MVIEVGFVGDWRCCLELVRGLLDRKDVLAEAERGGQNAGEGKVQVRYVEALNNFFSNLSDAVFRSKAQASIYR